MHQLTKILNICILINSWPNGGTGRHEGLKKFEWQGEKSPVISPKVGGNPFLNTAIRNLL